MPYDPEGALGTLMSIFLAYLGLQVGQVIINLILPIINYLIKLLHNILFYLLLTVLIKVLL